MRLLTPTRRKQMNEDRRSSRHFNTPIQQPITKERRFKVSDEEKKKRSEQKITDELGNQAAAEPGSPDEEASKERRAQAEKDYREAQDTTSH
jgi:hypothetical protein